MTEDDAEAARAFDPAAVPEGYFDHPERWFRRLRHHDPVHRNPDGSVLVTRYHDVKAVWHDPAGTVDKAALFAARFGDGPLLEHHTTAMLFRDPPAHDRLRMILNPFFSPAAVAQLRAFVTALADRLLDEAMAAGEVDFLRAFAFRVPTAVICRILGVPAEDGERLHAWGRDVIIPLNPGVPREAIEAGHRSAAAFKRYLAEHLDRQRRGDAELRPDTIIGAMLAAQRRGDPVSDDEILHSGILMFNGGHATTTHLLGLSLNALLDHPDQMRAWRDDPGLTPTAIEECIRYSSPLQYQGRRTTRELAIPSGVLPAGTEVVVCQASANRDETVFDTPDRLDLARRPNPHLAFGFGIHFCIGRALARLEMEICMSRLLSRCRAVERTGPVTYNRTPRFRALAALPVRLA